MSSRTPPAAPTVAATEPEPDTLTGVAAEDGLDAELAAGGCSGLGEAAVCPPHAPRMPITAIPTPTRYICIVDYLAFLNPQNNCGVRCA